MWTATVDFTKAFDSISHKSNWEAPKSCNVDHEYVCLLRKICRDQKASVHTDEESNIFDIQKDLIRRSDVQPAFQHSASVLIKGRNTTMAKEKKEWGYTWATMIMTASRT